MSVAPEFIESSPKRDPQGPLRWIVGAVAVSLSLFHLYAALFGMSSLTLRFVHLTGAELLTFMLVTARRGRDSRLALSGDLMLSALAVMIGVYLVIEFEDALDRNFKPNQADIVVSIIGILLVLEATRRAIGWQLPTISAIFLAYAYFGNFLPDPWGHAGRTIPQIAGRVFMSMEGIFGVPLIASATIVFLFLLLGAFLGESGIGPFFIELAMALFGRVRGGPAKAAVVSSALFGTISGSAVANVVGTGTFTIPLMKRLGYSPRFAGAVEAVASTGGQLMPPIMGSAAFIMAEVTGIPYGHVALAAMVPAILYYFSVFVQVDLEAGKLGLKGLAAEKLPKLAPLLGSNWPKMLPLGLLFYLLLILQWTTNRSALYTIFAAIVIGTLRPETRFNLPRLLRTLEAGARNVIEVASACACAGIIVGVLSLTGLGLKLSSILINIAHGNLILLLVLTMLASLVLGMGLPTTACYIILAVLVAPAIVKLGVSVMAAHLFVLYFGIISTITPPVALAAYAGASLAGADPMRTGWTATRLGIAAFIVPYMFIYGPSLLLTGTFQQVIWDVAIAIIGTACIAGAVEGFILTTSPLHERLLLFIGGVLMVHQGLLTDAIGFALAVLAAVSHVIFHRIGRRVPATT